MEEIKEYLKENLRIEISEDWYRDYGSSGTSIIVKLVLEGEVLSSDSFTITKD